MKDCWAYLRMLAHLAWTKHDDFSRITLRGQLVTLYCMKCTRTISVRPAIEIEEPL